MYASGNGGEGWLLSKEEIVEALIGIDPKTLGAETIRRAVDSYVEEAMYTERLVLGSEIIDAIDKRKLTFERDEKMSIFKIQSAAAAYLDRAEQNLVKYDDERSLAFQKAAEIILEDEESSRLTEAEAIIEQIRPSLIEEGFDFRYMIRKGEE